jgi:hypothetical protein
MLMGEEMAGFPKSPFPVDGMLGGFPIRLLDMIVSVILHYIRNRVDMFIYKYLQYMKIYAYYIVCEVLLTMNYEI